MSDASESSEVRRADPTARRRTVWIVLIGTCVGVALIAAFEHYRVMDWIRSEPDLAPQRLRVTLHLLMGLTVLPLLAMAAYVWNLGGKVMLARQFPPPRVQLIRDERVLTGERAVSRGRLLKVFAVALAMLAILAAAALWRLTALPGLQPTRMAQLMHRL